MSKNKNLNRKLSKYSNEEIYNKILCLLTKYIKLKKTQQISKQILKTYNLNFYSNDEAENIKFKISQLTTYAKSKNIKIPTRLCETEVTVDDVIDIIEESRYIEIRSIDEYCYRFDGYMGNGKWDNSDSNVVGADIRTQEVNELYDKVVNDVKKSFKDKVLIK